MKKIIGFENLEVFQRAYRVSLGVHELTLKFPKDERFGLSDQIRRASRGICANIAEGFGKQSYSKAEFRRFLMIALGSADEMRVWLIYCFDFGYIKEEQWTVYRDEYQEIAMMLRGLIRSSEK